MADESSPRTRDVSDLALEFFSAVKEKDGEKRRVRLARGGEGREEPLGQIQDTKPDGSAIKDC